MAKREESKPKQIKISAGAPARVLTTEEIAMISRTAPSRDKIARRAHELYRQRGGEQGNDVEDWVRAEKELKRLENEASMEGITVIRERRQPAEGWP
jgi:hypothetical protein